MLQAMTKTKYFRSMGEQITFVAMLELGIKK